MIDTPHTITRRRILLLCLAGLVFGASWNAIAQEAADKPPSPWGVSASASSSREIDDWFPVVSAAGVTTVRLFPEWRGVEPTQGNWKWDSADRIVDAAAKHNLTVNGVLMGSTPWSKAKIHAFPIDNLDGWANFVGQSIARYRGKIEYWEVWNEGNGGFNDDKHTTADYARLAIRAHEAGHAANPSARIGLTVASYDPAYIHHAALAMAKEGKPGRFDFVAIHPYEIADGLADPDGEVPFLWMTHQLRSLLRSSSPDRADVPIWITEVSRRISTHGRSASPQDAAAGAVKLYTMALAQGIACTQWFEARDPAGEDAGFGLLARDGRPRPAYESLKRLIATLGAQPKYLGWVVLGESGRGYGFVFKAGEKTITVAWSPVGNTIAVPMTQPVNVVDAVTGQATAVTSGQSLLLTNAPVFIVDAPFAAIAAQNASKPFPWGGSFTGKEAVSTTLGKSDGAAGITQVDPRSTPHCTYADGSTGIIARSDQAIRFYTHPSFAPLTTNDFYVRITVRRLAPGNVGMNLYYEAADTQGRMPYKNKGTWYSVPAGDGWHTFTWHLTDACFAKMWGYDFSFKAEQSQPFVIGKVEVSRTPLK
jgi:hypothetical protein